MSCDLITGNFGSKWCAFWSWLQRAPIWNGRISVFTELMHKLLCNFITPSMRGNVMQSHYIEIQTENAMQSHYRDLSWEMPCKRFQRKFHAVPFHRALTGNVMQSHYQNTERKCYAISLHKAWTGNAMWSHYRNLSQPASVMQPHFPT